MIIVISILSGLTPRGDVGRYVGGGIGRLAFIGCLLLVLYRLSWAHSAGFTWPDGGGPWVLTLLTLAYAVVASALALTGGLAFRLSDPTVDGIALLFIVIAATLEEVSFRGLLLHVFIRAWGPSTSGMIRGVIVSSLMFASIHLINVLGGDLPLDALLQAIGGIALGVVLGALTLKSGSLPPAIVLQAGLNISGYLALSSSAFSPSTSAWGYYCAVMIPLAIYGLYLMHASSRRPIFKDAA